MSEYYMDCCSTGTELAHYGVLGMKWGVRKATKALSSNSSAKRDKAVKSLEKHRVKTTAKLAKLNKQHVKLAAKADKRLLKYESRAARLESQSARLKRKMASRFTSDQTAFKLMRKSALLDQRVAKLRTDNANLKTKIAKNEKLQKTFAKGLSEIDAALTEQGRKRVRGA